MIIITSAAAAITTATDTPIATDDRLSCFHPAALVLDEDVNRILVLTVCVRVGVAVRLSGEFNPT